MGSSCCKGVFARSDAAHSAFDVENFDDAWPAKMKPPEYRPESNDTADLDVQTLELFMSGSSPYAFKDYGTRVSFQALFKAAYGITFRGGLEQQFWYTWKVRGLTAQMAGEFAIPDDRQVLFRAAQ
jgi:hypothetical protein